MSDDGMPPPPSDGPSAAGPPGPPTGPPSRTSEPPTGPPRTAGPPTGPGGPPRTAGPPAGPGGPPRTAGPPAGPGGPRPPASPPPPAAGSTPGSGQPRKGLPPWAIPLALVATIAVIAVIVLAGGDDDSATTSDSTAAPATVVGPGEVFAEPADDIGPQPFTPPVVTTTAPEITTTVLAATTAGASTTVAGASTTVAGATTTTVAGETTIATATPTALTIPSPTPVAGGPQVTPSVSGSQPGLYGGTRDNRLCDKEMMIRFLEENPVLGRAWASAQGIPVAEIGAYIRSLTPVLLLGDTRVTNYGFDGSRAVPRQAVLQAGTAVLVDRFGVPRARCKCGNPLGEPVAIPTAPVYKGPIWTGFSPTTIVVIVPANTPVVVLVLVDPRTGAVIERPVDGSADVPASSSTTGPSPPTTPPPTVPPTAPPSTAPPSSVTETTATSTTVAATTSTSEAPTTTAAPTTAAPVVVTDIARGGTVDASTVFGGNEFPASNAIDGRRETSWFSGGDADRNCVALANPGQSCSTLAWSAGGGADVTISEIRLLNNSQNSVPEFRSGFGFGSVTVIITDVAGTVVYDANFPLPGEDPDVSIVPNVRGFRMELVFEGHDNPDCGGISELQIFASA